MTVRELIAVLAARRWSALLLLLLVVAVVAGASLLQTRQYLAVAAVMIDTRSADPVANPGAGGPGNLSGFMATQIDLLQSERVALRASRALGLDQSVPWRDRWTVETSGRGAYEPWLADQLLKKLEVRPARESNVLRISYTATDPTFAAAAANAFVQAYIDTTLDMKVEPAKRYNAFFDDRAKGLRSALELAQGRLSAYQQAKGIVATDEKLDVETARLSELSSQVVLLQGVAAESSSRQVQAGANSQEVLSNLTVGTITADLARGEARLSEVRQRLGERNPQVLELAASVEQLRARLDVETRRVSSSLGLNSSASRSRLGAAQGALSEQRSRVLRLRGQRDEASVLLRDIDSAQRAYDAGLARVTQTSLESQSAFTNVSIIKTASVPPFASSPRVLLNTAVAVVVGSLLAIGLALMRESSDRRLRFDGDVTERLQQPLLATIPRSDRGPRPPRLGRHKARMIDRLVRVPA